MAFAAPCFVVVVAPPTARGLRAPPSQAACSAPRPRMLVTHRVSGCSDAAPPRCDRLLLGTSFFPSLPSRIRAARCAPPPARPDASGEPPPSSRLEAGRPSEAPVAAATADTAAAATAAAQRAKGRARAREEEEAAVPAVAALLRRRLGRHVTAEAAEAVARSVRRRHKNREVPALELAGAVLDLALEEWRAEPAALGHALAKHPRMLNTGAPELRARMAALLAQYPSYNPTIVLQSYYSHMHLLPASLARNAKAQGRTRRMRATGYSAERLAEGRQALREAGFSAKLVASVAKRRPHLLGTVSADMLRAFARLLVDELGLTRAELEQCVMRSPVLLDYTEGYLRPRLEYLLSEAGPAFDAVTIRKLLLWPAVFNVDLDKVKAFASGLERRGFGKGDVQAAMQHAGTALAQDVDALFARLEAVFCARLGLSAEELASGVRRAPSLLATTEGLARTVEALLTRGREEFGVEREHVVHVARQQPEVLCLKYEANLRPKLRLLRDFGALPLAMRRPILLASGLETRLWPRAAASARVELGCSLGHAMLPSDAAFAERVGLPAPLWEAYIAEAREALDAARAAGWPEPAAPPLTSFVPPLPPLPPRAPPAPAP
eukprot:tig00021017_g17199.t1